MLKPIAAGLMCLSVATLGVAASWGQDDSEKPKSVDVTVVEEAAGEAAPAADGQPVKEDDFKLVRIHIGDDGAAAVVNEGEPKRVEVRESGDLIILDAKDGKVVQRIQANPQNARVRFAGPPVADPGTREALERLVAGLKDEAKKLEGEGKKEDAERKLQSIRALEQLLTPGPRWAVSAGQRVAGDAAMFGRVAGFEEAGPAAEEMKNLHARLQELHAQMSKLPEAEREGRARLQQEMAELQKQIAERHQRRIAALPGAGPYPPMPPHAPGAYGPIAVPAGPGMPGGIAMPRPIGEAEIMMRRVQALRQAAEQLKQAGLPEQAGELAKQAEKLQTEFEKIRAQSQPGGADAFYVRGLPAMELHRSIHELQEQVQQLRKEVAEVRELLEGRPTHTRPPRRTDDPRPGAGR